MPNLTGRPCLDGTNPPQHRRKLCPLCIAAKKRRFRLRHLERLRAEGRARWAASRRRRFLAQFTDADRPLVVWDGV